MQDQVSRVMVIGHGFVGSRLTSELLASRTETVVLTRSPVPSLIATAGGDNPSTLAIVVAEAEDSVALNAVLEGVEHVYYCAGGLMPGAANADPLQDVTLALRPLLAVLESLRYRPGVGLTFLSSGGTVYGNPARLPVTEGDPTEPISAYGVSKLACEKYVLMYQRLYGVPVRVLRCSNVYGEDQPAYRGQGAIAVFLHRLLSGDPLVVFGDGLTVRDYIYVDDVVNAMIGLSALDDGTSVVNLGSGEGHSLNELISLIESITGLHAEVDRREGRGFDVRSVVLDTSRLRQLIDFRPTPLREGVTRMWRTLAGATTSAEPATLLAGPASAVSPPVLG